MKPRRILAVLMCGFLLWGGYRAYRAHINLVTLKVRNMDVRKVISKIEWQTWEHIIVNKHVSGHVTLDVHNVPLDEVLNIVSMQAAARWTALYPIYSTRKAGQTFRKVVQGEFTPAGNGWLNFQKIPLWQLGGASGFANILRGENKLVSAQIQNKDLDFAALALSRFSRAQVVPEDGLNGTINLKLDQAPLEKAVAQVAKQVHRKWDQFYTLQPLRHAPMVHKDPMTGNLTVSQHPPGSQNLPEVIREKTGSPPEQAMEAFLATMTPEERNKAQQQIATLQQLQTLPPAERQQRMQEMAAQARGAAQGDMMHRIQMRLKNGTPEQRVASDRRKLEQQRRNQKQ